MLCEIQPVTSRIWTRVATFISYDDNNYTTGTIRNASDQATTEIFLSLKSFWLIVVRLFALSNSTVPLFISSGGQPFPSTGDRCSIAGVSNYYYLTLSMSVHYRSLCIIYLSLRVYYPSLYFNIRQNNEETTNRNSHFVPNVSIIKFE